MCNIKHTLRFVVPRVLMALFLAVMVSLPNYSRAIESTRVYDEYLSTLFDETLSQFGTDDAYAFAPALAIPAALTAAGVTTETLATAFAALGTAVAGISIIQSWEDLSAIDKQQWATKENYIGALLLGMGFQQGWLTPGEPNGDGGNEPPQFNGDKGERWKQILIKLAAGGVGAMALAELGLEAKDLIDFFASPAGTDENGFPTGLGVTYHQVKVSDNLLTLKFISSCPYSIPSSYSNYTFLGLDEQGVAIFQSGGITLRFTDDRYVSSYSAVRLSSFSTYYALYKTGQTVSYNSTLYYRVDNTTASINGTVLSFLSDKLDLVGSDWSFKDGIPQGNITSSNLSLNTPSAISDMLKAVINAGVGTPAADQIINNYVTSNISNSPQYITVPSDITQTDDYEKVVTDTAPAPDPDPTPDPSDTESPADKAKKFLDLPVEQLFPFCLVYDIQLVIEHLAGGVPMLEDDSLVFNFNVGFGYFDAPLVIDLTDYADMQDAFHVAFDVLLVVGLLYFSISLFLKARGD